MAHSGISNIGWTVILTTTLATAIMAEGGAVRIITGDTTGARPEHGYLLKPGEVITISPGLTVSGWAASDGTAVTYIEGISGPSAIPGADTWGWVDYNDVATISTPIDLTLANTQYQLTNDGAGTNTNLDHKPAGHADIWDTATNEFDFSSLKIGDVVTVRGDIMFHASGVNRGIEVFIELGSGHGSSFLLSVAQGQFKTAGDHQIVGLYKFYIGAEFIRANPGRILAASDNTGDSITVNGWFIETSIR